MASVLLWVVFGGVPDAAVLLPEGRANVAVLACRGTWLVIVPPEHEGAVELRYVEEPVSVSLAGDGAALPFSYEAGTLRMEIPKAARSPAGNEIDVRWKESRWEETIRAFEEQDAQTPPPKDAVLFVGSSTIVMWKVAECFPGLVVLNRGFGGSQFADLLRHADRVVRPYAPKTIVVYSGDNDIASGKSPDWVFADFEAALAAFRRAAPDTPVIAIGIKPSIARWDKYGRMQEVNRRIAALAEKDPHLEYVDLGPLLVDAEGKPRPELFLKDGLHLNTEGYALWAEALKPLLAQ